MKTRRLPGWLALFTISLALITWHQASAGPGDALTGSGTGSLGQQQPAFLKADDAFQFDAWKSNDQLTLAWRIADGYYLYQHRFQIKPEHPGASALVPVSFPDGINKQDDYFGAITAYYGQVELSVALESLKNPDVREIRVVFQGCADAGLCYPPQKRMISLAGDGTLDIRKITPGR